MTSVLCNDIEICLEKEVPGFDATLTCNLVEEGVYEVNLTLHAETVSQLSDVKLAWEIPSVDFHHKWNSECFQNRALDAGTATANFVTSRANRQAPVYSLYNLESVNTCTFALSDAIHDVRMGGNYGSGKTYKCSATLAGAKVDPLQDYVVTLRFDFRRIPYYQCLNDIVAWWEQMAGYTPCHVPKAARLPLFSSWYIYEVNVDADDLEKQCAMAKTCGFDVTILDDGWQTDQVEFGYQNNGDWEVSTQKFPDFAAHVKRVQDLGMKYMVWFSVPFVGVDSKAYHTMRPYLLPGREGARWFGLDPRFPEAREYLANKFEDFVKTYKVDGLKMDFIGSIGGRPQDETARLPGHDTVSIGEGVCRLLEDTRRRLDAINPDILIEFRQAYIGPAMRKYGNMFRAVDCPNSAGDNRVRTLDVRLLSGTTSVHSDPITWHDDEPSESAAMQLIHALFSVPQISRRISELTADHTQMLKTYLAFWRQHRGLLMEGDLAPLYPHLLYPLVTARKADTQLSAFYGPVALTCTTDLPATLILVNGTYKQELMLDVEADLGTCQVTTVDCLGNVTEGHPCRLTPGIHKIPVPKAGHATLVRCK